MTGRGRKYAKRNAAYPSFAPLVYRKARREDNIRQSLPNFARIGLIFLPQRLVFHPTYSISHQFMARFKEPLFLNSGLIH